MPSLKGRAGQWRRSVETEGNVTGTDPTAAATQWASSHRRPCSHRATEAFAAATGAFARGHRTAFAGALAR